MPAHKVPQNLQGGLGSGVTLCHQLSSMTRKALQGLIVYVHLLTSIELPAIGRRSARVCVVLEEAPEPQKTTLGAHPTQVRPSSTCHLGASDDRPVKQTNDFGIVGKRVFSSRIRAVADTSRIGSALQNK